MAGLGVLAMSVEQDYVLGTHDEELARLGLQHRVWRARMLEAWRRAGVTTDSRVLDVGAGPGYATLDLAEMVGPGGVVVGVERSARFVTAGRAALAARGLDQGQLHELDLMTDELPGEGFDVAWCRWVASFVSDPERLVRSIGAALKPGGRVVFHEYADYASWRLGPRRPAVEAFVAEVMASWRASGGEPDVAPALVGLLGKCRFRIVHAAPIVFAVHPGDFVWRWPASFVESNLRRLTELGRVDGAWCARVREEWSEAEADPASVLITPMVLEVVAVKG